MKWIALLLIVLPFSLLRGPLAYAKDVSITWKAIKKATSYELRVESKGRILRSEKARKPGWSGDLQFGVFGYQIRAIDRIGRPGKWSELKPLAVMPESPELELPKDGATLVYYDPRRSPKLSWTKVEGVSRYEVEVLRGSQVVFQQETAATDLELPVQSSAAYSWRVKPVMDPGSMNAFRGKKWKGKPRKSFEFKLDYRKLEAPVALSPVGPLTRGQGADIDFRWKEVEGAEAYEIRFAPARQGRQPAATEYRHLVTQEPSISARPVPDGSWVWEVRALASYDSQRRVASVSGAETRADFQVETSGAHPEGKGYVAFSGMFAPYTYRIESPEATADGSVKANSFVSRLSGEYWPISKLGGSIALNQGFMSFSTAGATSTASRNDSNLTRTDLELYAKTQFMLGGWYIQPKLGFMHHEYLRVLPSGNSKVGTSGPGFGLDIRHPLSERWSLGFKFEYYIPRTLSLNDYSPSLYGHDTYRNTSVGLQAIYWLGGRWGLGAGAFVEQRSLRYRFFTGRDEVIQMDGMYFFGSLIYSWGR